MIVMHMGHDHLVDASGRQAEVRQHVRRCLHDGPVAQLPLLRIEAGIDEDRLRAVLQHPDIEIDGMRRMVIIGEQEGFPPRAVFLRGIAQCIDFPGIAPFLPLRLSRF